MKRFIHFLLLTVLASIVLSAADNYRLYKFKSGVVLYDVKTSSFDDTLNSHVQGIARLVFSEWGLNELKEEDVSEVQSGDFNDTKSRHTLTLVNNGTINSVDFEEKTIYKTRDRDLDLAITKKLDLSNESVKSLEKLGAIKEGNETVAGYVCDIWKYNHQEVCMYKGIPLKIVIQNAGFYSEKKAVKVLFDANIPESEFTLPDYKKVVDDAYSTNRSSVTRTEDYISSIIDLKSEMKKKGINLEDKNISITEAVEKDIINALGKRYLTKQKKYLPSLIDAMKTAKKCISNSKNREEAKKCLIPVTNINNKLGDKAPSFDFENFNSEKERAVKVLDKEIKNTEVTVNCVDKFSKTTDVIVCTEGKLLPQESSSSTVITTDTNESSSTIIVDQNSTNN